MTTAVRTNWDSGEIQAGGHLHSPAEERYRNEIDGLRCLAVIPVVLFHAGIPLFSGGFVGVDVFFVISGYLITGILHREAEQGRLSIAKFYERRIRRIFPALFSMLAAVTGVSMFLLLPDEMVGLGRQVAATSLFASNIIFWQESGYFEAASAAKPLLHTWSLAVEEQYYILFPPVLWFLVRRHRSLLLPAMVGVSAASLLLSVYIIPGHPDAAFYLLPARAWELMVGGIVAVLRAPLRGRITELVSWAGLAAIIVPVMSYEESMTFPGVAALPPCLGAAALLWGARGTQVGQMLSLPAVRGVGLISYSLYLWHWPVIVFLGLRVGNPLPTWIAVIAVAASLVFGYLSWRFVERPVRRAGSARLIWAIGGASIIGGVILAAALVTNRGLPDRFHREAIALVQRSIADGDAMEKAYSCANMSLDGKDKRFGPCPIGVAGDRVDLVVVGDSESMALKPAFSKALRRLGKSGMLLSVPGCTPLLGLDRVRYSIPCAERADHVKRYVLSVRPTAIIFVAAWRGALTSKNTIAGGVASSDDASRLRNVQIALNRTIEFYRGQGLRVGILLPMPGTPTEAARALARGASRTPVYSRKEHEQTFAGLRAAVSAARPDVVGNPADVACNEECASLTSKGTPLYWDQSHPNDAGNAFFSGIVEDTAQKLLAVPPMR